MSEKKNFVKNSAAEVKQPVTEAQAQAMSASEYAERTQDILERMQREEAERIKERRNKIVKGTFRNLEKPGMEHAFSFREFKGKPIEHYKFKDNGVYEVPLYIAEHLNNNCVQKTFRQDSERSGRNTLVVESSVSRFAFNNISFF